MWLTIMLSAATAFVLSVLAKVCTRAGQVCVFCQFAMQVCLCNYDAIGRRGPTCVHDHCAL